MTFRIMRNDAIQKYRAQFDLAARYAYLAAATYDYETNLLGSNAGSESTFVAGSPNADGDFVGTEAVPIDPELNPLADYGGFAPDHRPALVVGRSAGPQLETGR